MLLSGSTGKGIAVLGANMRAVLPQAPGRSPARRMAGRSPLADVPY